jgi:hypothetical protein
VLVFLALAVFYPMWYFSGGSLTRTSLGGYYLREFDHMLNSSGVMGPKSDSGSLPVMFLIHIAASALGGGLVLAARRVFTRRDVRV